MLAGRVQIPVPNWSSAFRFMQSPDELVAPKHR